MTLNCYKFDFSRNFAWLRRFGRQQQLNKWSLYRQQQNCSPLNVRPRRSTSYHDWNEVVTITRYKLLVTKVRFWIAFVFQQFRLVGYIMLPVREMASAVVDVGLWNPLAEAGLKGGGGSCPSGRVLASFGRVQYRSGTKFKTGKPLDAAAVLFRLKFADYRKKTAVWSRGFLATARLSCLSIHHSA